MKERGWLGLHTAIWKVASTHVVVDAYTNMYAPLLPLLIPQLGLSLATAGMLAMCFQMANSVSQLGFGALADRWRPRVLVIGGPLLAVIVLSMIGLAVIAADARRRFSCSAVSAARRFIRRRRRWSTARGSSQGPRDVGAISGGSLGFAAAPVLFAPFIAYMGLQWSPLVMIPGPARAVVDTAAGAGDVAAACARAIDVATCGLRGAARLLYFTIVLRTATTTGS